MLALADLRASYFWSVERAAGWSKGGWCASGTCMYGKTRGMVVASSWGGQARPRGVRWRRSTAVSGSQAGWGRASWVARWLSGGGGLLRGAEEVHWAVR
jgi:hypothetical protein